MSRRVVDDVLGESEYAADEVDAPTAKRLYEMWHQKEPNGAHIVEFEFPSHLCCVGRAEAILYHSDKWEEDGKGYDYEHKFDTEPNVYAPVDTRIFERSNPVVETSKIIRGDIDGRIEMPMLALVKEFVINKPRGGRKTLRFTRNLPLMCMTHDAKGLVIFAEIDGEPCPLFVRGGKMHVTSHGIVK